MYLCVNGLFEIFKHTNYQGIAILFDETWVALKRAGWLQRVLKVTSLCIDAGPSPAFLMKFVCQPLCHVPFKYKLFLSKSCPCESLNTMLIVDKHCSDICCDEFTVPQTD